MTAEDWGSRVAVVGLAVDGSCDLGVFFLEITSTCEKVQIVVNTRRPSLSPSRSNILRSASNGEQKVLSQATHLIIISFVTFSSILLNSGTLISLF